MKQSIRYLLWVLFATLWTTVCFILPDFTGSPMDGFYGTLHITAYIAVCGFGTFLILYIIGCSRYLSAVILPVWSLVGAVLSFYRIGYHATLTPVLLDVVLHTNTEEALGVLSWQLMVWVVFNLFVAGLLIWFRWRTIRLPYAWVHGLVLLALWASVFFGFRRVHNSLCQRYPYNVPYTIHEYTVLQHSMDAPREMPNYTVIEQPDSLTIVLVLGEAVRADHLQLNGYERETTPRLNVRTNLVSLPHIYTDKTHTSVSLPDILTRGDSLHAERVYTETSFISVLNEAQYHTAWISNQDMGPMFAHFVAESDTAMFANADKSVFVFSQWLDEELLPLMENAFVTRPKRVCYVLHTIGSHWYYDNHVPTDKYFFRPTTTNRVVTANTVEQVVNSYDNTIRYMDAFVDSIIASLVDEKALLIYQSDHGEALGENGMFLHANGAEVAMNPACMIWYSDRFKEAYPDKIKALISNKDKRYRTDYVFYSILYAAGIEAEGDCPQMNIFRE